eukprot:scaffold1351_cov359-Prasinococcus_capsulatus_cf.AAC.3
MTTRKRTPPPPSLPPTHPLRPPPVRRSPPRCPVAGWAAPGSGRCRRCSSLRSRTRARPSCSGRTALAACTGTARGARSLQHHRGVAEGEHGEPVLGPDPHGQLLALALVAHGHEGLRHVGEQLEHARPNERVRVKGHVHRRLGHPVREQAVQLAPAGLLRAVKVKAEAIVRAPEVRVAAASPFKAARAYWPKNWVS